MIFSLFSTLWQSVEPNILSTFRSFKTYYSFWTKARHICANDIQCLYDYANHVASLKQSNNDMMSFIPESIVEELKRLLEVNSLDEIKKKLDKFCMAMILRAMNLDFDDV